MSDDQGNQREEDAPEQASLSGQGFWLVSPLLNSNPLATLL